MDEQNNLNELNEEIAEVAKIAETEAEPADVSRETQPEEPAPAPGWSCEYVLTEEEMRTFAECSGVVTSKRKTRIQGGFAAALCVLNAITYATGGRKLALFLAIACAALCGAVFAVPFFGRRNLVNQMKAAADKGITTRVAGDGVSLHFGAGEDVLSYPYDQAKITVFETIATVLLSDGQMVCVPRRALPDEGFNELCAHVTADKKK